MYWEEIIELIKTHGKEPKSKFSNKYNDSDRYVVYEYERGTVKTSYLHINEFSRKIKNCLKKYLKYGINNIQIFASLGASEGMGIHDDEDDVLILCLEGEMSYVIEDRKTVTLKSGDTIFIKKVFFIRVYQAQFLVFVYLVTSTAHQPFLKGLDLKMK